VLIDGEQRPQAPGANGCLHERARVAGRPLFRIEFLVGGALELEAVVERTRGLPVHRVGLDGQRGVAVDLAQSRAETGLFETALDGVDVPVVDFVRPPRPGTQPADGVGSHQLAYRVGIVQGVLELDLSAVTRHDFEEWRY
jgi:hypothetical protein